MPGKNIRPSEVQKVAAEVREWRERRQHALSPDAAVAATFVQIGLETAVKQNWREPVALAFLAADVKNLEAALAA